MSGRKRSSPLTRASKRSRPRRTTAAGNARRSSPASEKGNGRPARFQPSPSDSLLEVEEDDEAELLDILYWLGEAPNDGGDGEAPRARVWV